MPSSTSFLAAAAFLPAVFAHYNFEALIVNGNITSPYEYVRQTNNSNSYVNHNIPRVDVAPFLRDILNSNSLAYL